MVAAILSRAVIVVAGILYPAYSSFKAVRARSHREYTQWMMYWIVFAMFQAAEVVTDTFIAWVPFYFELKILFVLWLVLPITQGSKQLYRVVIHPFLLRHETEIDDTIQHFGEKGIQVFRKMSQQGLNLAATTVVTSAIKGQAVITETLLKNQQQQQQQGQEGQEQEQIDGGLATHPASGDENRRHQHLSSSSSSHFSDGFEVIGEEEPEVELYGDPPDHHSPPPPSHHAGDNLYYQKPESNGVYHRT